MDDLASFAKRPLAFSLRFVRRRGVAHAAILGAVALAVVCSIFTQYGVKLLVDTLSLVQRSPTAAWHVFALLVGLIAADNLLWRLAAWVGNHTFASVTGDVRRELFHHLTGHAPSYFATWQPGVLTSRISATSNAMFTVENLLVWNVLPPCMATIWAIALVATVSFAMAAGLVVVAILVIAAMFLWAAAGKPLHHEFASRAAAVDGELTDVVGNMAMVKAFGGIAREHERFDVTVGQEIAARQRSLRYLERLRIVHALVTVALTIGLLTWVLILWQEGRATTGDVILVCTLGLSVLHATRDAAHRALHRGPGDPAGPAPALRPARRQDARAQRQQRHLR
jgi:ATP-binding cassette subfamily B protein